MTRLETTLGEERERLAQTEQEKAAKEKTAIMLTPILSTKAIRIHIQVRIWHDTHPDSIVQGERRRRDGGRGGLEYWG